MPRSATATRRSLRPVPRSACGASRRVYIRRPTAHDEAAYLDMVRVSRDLHRPWMSPAATRSAFAEYLERSRRPDREYLLIVHRADRVLVGAVNIGEIVLGAFQSAYMGYFANAPLAGRGLMTEGMRLVLKHAFRTLRLHRLEANIQPQNLRSIALVRRLGFQREGYSPRYLKIGGRWRDHERWAIRAEMLRSSR